jgi:hypothetical protein
MSIFSDIYHWIVTKVLEYFYRWMVLDRPQSLALSVGVSGGAPYPEKPGGQLPSLGLLEPGYPDKFSPGLVPELTPPA